VIPSLDAPGDIKCHPGYQRLDVLCVGASHLSLSLGWADPDDYVQAVISSVITRAVAAELPVGVDATSGAQANRYAEQDATTLVTGPADGRAGSAIAEREPAARPLVPRPLPRAAPIGPSLVAALALPRVMKSRVAQALDSCPSARIVGGSPRARKRSAGAADDTGKALRTLTIAVDDTLFKRSGKKVFGVAWHHDGAAKGPKPIASPTPTIWRASAKACSRTVSGRLTSSFAASRSAGRR
jgi:hypothetical protein